MPEQRRTVTRAIRPTIQVLFLRRMLRRNTQRHASHVTRPLHGSHQRSITLRSSRSEHPTNTAPVGGTRALIVTPSPPISNSFPASIVMSTIRQTWTANIGIRQATSMQVRTATNATRREEDYESSPMPHTCSLVIGQRAGFAARSAAVEMYRVPYNGGMERTLLDHVLRTFADSVLVKRTAQECTVQTMSHNAALRRDDTGMCFVSSERFRPCCIAGSPQSRIHHRLSPLSY